MAMLPELGEMHGKLGAMSIVNRWIEIWGPVLTGKIQSVVVISSEQMQSNKITFLKTFLFKILGKRNDGTLHTISAN